MTGYTYPRARRRLLIAGIIGGLALAVLAKIVGPALPVLNGHSLNEVQPYCTGVMGAFVRGLGGAEAQRACNDIGTTVLVLNLVALAGLAMAAVAGWALWRDSRKAVTTTTSP